MKIVFCGLLLAVLTGCAGTRFEWDNAKAVHVGTTQAELIELLGKPYLVKSQNGAETWIWSYSGLDGTKLVSYVLVNGVVTVVPTILN
jgi:hypothetical protein